MLIVAILLGLYYPALGMKTAEPENPLEEESIREITVLKAGENISQMNSIVVPNGGSAAPTEPDETDETDETNPNETKPEKTKPEETESDTPNVGGGDEGQENGHQGEEGGETLQPDLVLELTWTQKDGTEKRVSCGADSTELLSVKNYELTERVFPYTTKLTGSLAKDAKITDVECTTDSGEAIEGWYMDRGAPILSTATNSDTGTYHLTFTVQSPEGEAFYHYTIVYREVPDVQLSFTYYKGMAKQTKNCQPGETVSDVIKNNQLSGQALPYTMELIGTDAENCRILGISYVSEGAGKELGLIDSIPMSMQDGTVYTITLYALINKQTITFTIVLNYGYDVVLQMQYKVYEGGTWKPEAVSCENGKKSVEVIYDDQLTDGRLEYQMSITGSDGDNTEITSVQCYQSGNGRITRLNKEDEIQLWTQKDGKAGENTFTVKAEDDAGNSYQFTILISYKHKGKDNIQIETDPESGKTIINETKNDLIVSAFSDEAGYLTASEITVWLDGQEITEPTSSGRRYEYALYPKNPEVGDTNIHTVYIYAEDAYGNYGEKTLELIGQRNEPGQKIGNALIYVDMTVLGIGVIGPVRYSVLADEPVSYTIAKAVMGEDTGEPFGAADDTFGFIGENAGKLDAGFYLQRLYTGYSANALEGSSWPGSSEEEVLQAIDDRFGRGSGLATLWRCLYRNGLNKSSGSGSSFGEYDYTNGSGWMYSVGGSTYYPGQSMSSVYLKDGDVLTLRYTLAYGWDVGGGSPGYGSTVGYCVSAVNGSFQINHQMETIENENGSFSYVCHCCGLVEECGHENKTYIDLGDGCHILHCMDCSTDIGDPEAHVWEYDGSDGGENHTCAKCGASEAHRWRETEGSNTATCTEPGTKIMYCEVCGMTSEQEAPAKGHMLNNRWNHTSQTHYQKCSVCGEIIEGTRGVHQYVYDAELDDWLCELCGAGHAWDYCGNDGLLITSATCQRIDYHCDECGLNMHKDGYFEEYHFYENGYCLYCGSEDPAYPTPGDTGEADDFSEDSAGSGGDPGGGSDS